MVFSMTVLLDVRSSLTGQVWLQILIALISIGVFPIAIAYSRLLLGAHSLNQVFFGMLLGFWLALTLHFLVRECLLSYIKRIIDA